MDREDGETQPKVLRVGILTPVPGLNPRRGLDRLSWLAVSQIFETPYGIPRGDGPAEAVLFDGPLEREDDEGNVLSARVRRGIRFSDGTEMTAEHVVSSLLKVEAFVQEATVRSEGERLVFELKCANPRFDLALTLLHCSIVLEKEGRLLGTGPFVPATEPSARELRLVPNPHYRGSVALDAVQFRVYPPDDEGRPTALLEALDAQEVDFTNVLSRRDVSSVHGYRKAFQPSSSTAILFFNTECLPLADARIRRALAQSVDRRAVTETSYSNVDAFVASSLLPPMMGAGRERLPFDPEAARRSLESAGGAPRGPLRMLVVWAPRPYLPYPRPVAEKLVEQFAAVGVRVKVEVAASAREFFDRQRARDYEMVLGGWIADNADPSEFLEANLLSDRVPVPGARGVARCNLSRIQNPELDQALETYRSCPDPVSRERVLEIVAREAPLVPLMYGPAIVVHSWRVQNVEISPLGEPQFALMDIDG